MDIQALSKQFGVNAEKGKGGDFPIFLKKRKGESVLLLSDLNTQKYAQPILCALRENGCRAEQFVYPEYEPVADEKTVRAAVEQSKNFEYILAVGAGTLNDMAKYTGFVTGKPSGVFATAPSMDGFTSGVTPLIENGFKVTRPAQVAEDVLMDMGVLSTAPNIMKGAGVGDILAKYCCLTDWKISSILTGEEYGEEAASLMREAVRACDESISALKEGEPAGAEALMNALLVSGYAMVIAGNSRPASGAEHHMSHYLEMDFLRRGKRIPLHGVKVGLGTMVSLWLYHTLKERPAFENCEKVYLCAEKLPSVDYVEGILHDLGCPTRFSELDVPKDTVRDMLFEAYKIRDRFTILTLYCKNGFMKAAADDILERFY